MSTRKILLNLFPIIQATHTILVSLNGIEKVSFHLFFLGSSLYEMTSNFYLIRIERKGKGNLRLKFKYKTQSIFQRVKQQL